MGVGEEGLVWGGGGGGIEEKMIGCHWVCGVTWDHLNQQHQGFAGDLMCFGPFDQMQQTQGSQENFTATGVPGHVEGSV